MSHLDTVHALYAAFGRGDIPTILGLLADDIEWEHDAEGWESLGVPWLRPGRGREHVLGFFQSLQGLDFHAFAPVSFLANDTQVAAILSVEATVRATGRRFRETEVHLWSFGEDGRVARFRHFVDTAKFAAATRA